MAKKELLECKGCGIEWPFTAILDTGCPACRAGRVVPYSFELEHEGKRSPYVWVDASFHQHEGIAGLAICGALGSHLRLMYSSSSTEAEVEVLRMAIRIAQQDPIINGLIFRSDCHAAVSQCRNSFGFHDAYHKENDWRLEQIRGYNNTQADRLADAVRRGMISPTS